MPVISFNYHDFTKLVGKKYSLEELEDIMPMMGMEWEGVSGDEISVEVFPNRPDLLSVEGLARAFKAFVGIKTGLINYKLKQSNYEIIVDKEIPIRPFIYGAVVKGLKLDDETIRSLMQIQEKLHITHCRNRKKAAIGVHDLRMVKFPVHYTSSPPDKIFVPLGERESMSLKQILKQHPKGIAYAHLLKNAKEYPLVVGNDGEVLSFPPIINSEFSKLRPNTKDLFIDVTGTNETTMLKALNIITTMLIDRGAKVYQVKISTPTKTIHTPDYTPTQMSLDINYCRKILGENLPLKIITSSLKKMGHGILKHSKDEVQVLIPCYRTDIMHQYDLIEDVAVGYGYENFEPVVPKIYGVGTPDILEERSSYVKDILIGFNFIEVNNWYLLGEELLSKAKIPKINFIEILNPRTTDFTLVRKEIYPQMLHFLSLNKRNEYPQKIFEIGPIVRLMQGDPHQELHLSLAICHSKANYSEIKSLLDVLFKELDAEVSYKPIDLPVYIKGRAAEIFYNNTSIGHVGEVSPEVLDNFELTNPVVLSEINIEHLLR